MTAVFMETAFADLLHSQFEALKLVSWEPSEVSGPVVGSFHGQASPSGLTKKV